MVLTNVSNFDGEEGRRQELKVCGGKNVGGASEGATERELQKRIRGSDGEGASAMAASLSGDGGFFERRRRRRLPASSLRHPLVALVTSRQPPENARGVKRFSSTPARRVSAGFLGPKRAKTGLPNSPNVF
jgi:hypothetical protein